MIGVIQSALCPPFILSNRLTQEQLDFYHENGYLHFKNFISRDTVNAAISAMEEIQKRWIAEDVKKVNGVPIKYGSDLNGEKMVQRFAFSSLSSDVLHELIQDVRLKALFDLLLPEQGRIGENEKDGLVINHYINHENSKFTKMGWHTDALRDVFYGKKIMPMLNVGIHLDGYQSKNGGLRIIPGSHKQSISSLLFRKKYFLDNNPDPAEIGLNVDAGDLTVHDGRLWHRVAKSSLVGEESRRRVMYLPIISGEYKPKDETSSTRLYQRFMNVLN